MDLFIGADKKIMLVVDCWAARTKTKIEICLEGCYTDYKNLNLKRLYPKHNFTALIWLCNDIKTRWTIKAIKRKHADYPSAKQEGKDCPGKYFPWDKFLNEVDGMNLIKFQTAAKHIGVYNDEIDNKAGPNTRAAAEEFLKITLQILGLQDPRNC